MNQSFLTISLIVLTATAFVFIFILNHQKLKLKSEMQRISTPNEELKNYQTEIFNREKAELTLKNVSDEKLAELKLQYEKKINTITIEFEKEKNDIKEKLREERELEYQKGFDQGVKSSNISVHVMPYKEVTKDDGIFFKEDIVLLGYKYQLFSNGIPCLESHIEITEKMQIKEVKEENIKIALAKIEEIISKIPNPNIQMIGSIKDFGKGVLDLKKK